MALPFVSVIIPVLNDCERLSRCLTALREQEYPQDMYEVVVVDNASSEDIKGLAEKFKCARYVLEPMPGPAAARNAGIGAARGKVLAFTDSDCSPAKDWVARGVSRLSSLPKCGLVAGKIELYYKDSERATSVELYDTVSYLGQKRYVEKYRFGATANLFTSREVIDKVGVFNSTLFKTASGEDAEWGERVFAAGYKQAYADNVRVLHPATHSFLELYRKTKRITLGNIILNRAKGNCGPQPAVVSLSETIKFHYTQIWKGEVVKGWHRKLEVSFIAAVMIGVKIWTKITHMKT